MNNKNTRILKLIKKAKDSYSKDNLVIVIPQFMSRKFVSYCSIREDLLLVKEYISRLENEEDSLIKSSLTYSAISFYGKCFTNATASQSSKPEANKLFEEGSDLEETHEYLINLRHYFIAHRGDTEGETGIAYLLHSNDDSEAQVRFSGLKMISFSSEQRLKTVELIEHILTTVEEKIEKAGKKVLGSLLSNLTPDQMSHMVVNNILNIED